MVRTHGYFYSRASPLEKGLTPAEMLMKRKLGTRVPSAKCRKEHSPSNNPKEYQVNAYNRTVVPLKPLAQEEIHIWVRCGGQWGPLTKVIKVTGPRSNEVITEHGQETPVPGASKKHDSHGQQHQECDSPRSKKT